MPRGEPVVAAGDGGLSHVRGTFHRAIDPAFRATALIGSRSAGRYSRPSEPTLYLSSSREGVAAAMVAHAADRAEGLEVVDVAVDADRIVDLRDPGVLDGLGVRLEDATAPWQEVVAAGGTPSSWHVRDALVEAGAHGVIDASRQSPGLWHLVLFAWNAPGAPTATLV